MIMLVAGGDSIVWGSELADSPHGGANGYSRSTFTALLAGKDYVCAAYPGIGNRDIVARVKDAIGGTTASSVIVCWTWSTRDNKVNSDSEILDLQHYLINRDLPYLFTCVDNSIISNNDKIDWSKWYMFPPAKEPYNTMEPRGFYQWAVENKYSMAPEGHPLEAAHADAAEMIKEKFNELVKKSI